MTTDLTEHIQKRARETNVPTIQTEHIPNSAQQYNVAPNRTEHIKAVHEALEYQTIIQNTNKTVRKGLT